MEGFINSYNKLPVGKYQEIQKIDREEKDVLDRQVKILAVLADTTEDVILDLPIQEYKEMVIASKFLEGVPTLSTMVAMEYMVGDFILVPVKDMRKMTAGQYIDFMEYSKHGEEMLVESLSALLVPKGHKYNTDYDIIQVQEAIRENMSVASVLSLAAFFLNLYRQSIEDTLTYSRKMAQEIVEEERRQMVLEQIKEQEELLRRLGDG